MVGCMHPGFTLAALKSDAAPACAGDVSVCLLLRDRYPPFQVVAPVHIGLDVCGDGRYLGLLTGGLQILSCNTAWESAISAFLPGLAALPVVLWRGRNLSTMENWRPWDGVAGFTNS